VCVDTINDALDRAGIQAKTAVDVSVTAKPYETVLDSMVEMSGGSRSEHRRARGIEDVNTTRPAAGDHDAMAR
jgi:hypothetical protein